MNQTEQLMAAVDAYADQYKRDGATPLTVTHRKNVRATIEAALKPGEPIENAMKTVIGTMQAEPDYAWGWHCNIAMAFFDAGGDIYTANQGAARFMRLLANVEPAHELPTAPQPQREWVGLDRKEIMQIVDQQGADTKSGLPMFYRDQCLNMARIIEQTLRERNGRAA